MYLYRSAPYDFSPPFSLAVFLSPSLLPLPYLPLSFLLTKSWSYSFLLLFSSQPFFNSPLLFPSFFSHSLFSPLSSLLFLLTFFLHPFLPSPLFLRPPYPPLLSSILRLPLLFLALSPPSILYSLAVYLSLSHCFLSCLLPPSLPSLFPLPSLLPLPTFSSLPSSTHCPPFSRKRMKKKKKRRRRRKGRREKGEMEKIIRNYLNVGADNY